jgi:hypothetical protein
MNEITPNQSISDDEEEEEELANFATHEGSSVTKLKRTALNHFAEFLRLRKEAHPNAEYADIEVYKEKPRDRPPDHHRVLANKIILGEFAAHLFYVKEIPKFNTCVGYVSAMKCMMEDDFPDVPDMKQGRWYKRCRKNIKDV